MESPTKSEKKPLNESKLRQPSPNKFKNLSNLRKSSDKKNSNRKMKISPARKFIRAVNDTS